MENYENSLAIAQKTAVEREAQMHQLKVKLASDAQGKEIMDLRDAVHRQKSMIRELEEHLEKEKLLVANRDSRLRDMEHTIHCAEDELMNIQGPIAARDARIKEVHLLCLI